MEGSRPTWWKILNQTFVPPPCVLQLIWKGTIHPPTLLAFTAQFSCRIPIRIQEIHLALHLDVKSSQLANYWRRYFQIPEIPPDGNWLPHHYEAPESPASVQESGMDDADSIIANVDITPPPVQIHQLATFLWNILINDIGMPTWPYSNVSRILMMTFPDTRFRSSRRQIWLTLPVTWRNLHAHCRTKHVAWRHFLTRPCELSD